MPPFQLALLTILQHHAGCSDEEAAARCGYDLRWAAALGREGGRPLCAKSTFQCFRAHRKGTAPGRTPSATDPEQQHGGSAEPCVVRGTGQLSHADVHLGAPARQVAFRRGSVLPPAPGGHLRRVTGGAGQRGPLGGTGASAGRSLPVAGTNPPLCRRPGAWPPAYTSRHRGVEDGYYVGDRSPGYVGPLLTFGARFRL
ncbi:MAG: transposase [Armatimonadetes bacterium]|nr:transposase [Armatimonadota bacterium]